MHPLQSFVEKIDPRTYQIAHKKIEIKIDLITKTYEIKEFY